MNRKRVSLNEQINKIFGLNSFENKENLINASNLSEKIFKTPEKKQITIENKTTTVTITNYFNQSKYHFQRENTQFKGLEKKLDFDDPEIKNEKQQYREKPMHKSNSAKKKPNISITFSELKKNGFKLNSKRFNSSQKDSKSNTIQTKVKNVNNSDKSLYPRASTYSAILDDCIKQKENLSEDTEASIDSDVCCHSSIPFDKINDESYKIKVLSKLRKPEISSNKSVNCKFYEYKRRPFNYDGNITKFCELYNLKRRKVTSMTKVYQGFGEFIDQETGKKMAFNFYEDNQIGFTREWQKKLRITEMDDDIMTDEEQLLLARKHIIKEIHEAFKQFRKKSFNTRN